MSTIKRPAYCVAIATDKVFDKTINQMLILHEGKWQFCRDGQMMREGTPHHLYFTTDDTFNMGDWIIRLGDITRYSPQAHNLWECKKIVATTNKELWNIHPKDDGTGWPADMNTPKVPKIPLSFVQKYAELGGIDKVMLGYEHRTNATGLYTYTLEDPVLKLCNTGEVAVYRVEQKMYTYEELRAAARDTWVHSNNIIVFDDWFDRKYPE